jgi:hypothetical protein
MNDIDITGRRPLHVGVYHRDTTWSVLPDNVVRVRAGDLRGVAHRAAAARREHPGRDVVIDIDVVIAREAHSARTALTDAGGHTDSDSLLYVGTAAGLAGLITDLYVLGITDGAILIPAISDDTTLGLIRDDVLPELDSLMQRRTRTAIQPHTA